MQGCSNPFENKYLSHKSQRNIRLQPVSIIIQAQDPFYIRKQDEVPYTESHNPEKKTLLHIHSKPDSLSPFSGKQIEGFCSVKRKKRALVEQQKRRKM